MLNVIIVDDEPLVRITLKSIVPWEKYGLYVLDEAENGKQCLDILEKYDIDIIVTDIKMPAIDGLELIKIVKEKYPHILIVVLSAYGEFNLVKKALLSGAEDYILKSEINEQSTENTLLNLRVKYENNRIKLQSEMDLKKDITENIDVLRTNFFKGLLSNNSLTETQIERKVSQYQITLSSQQMILIVLTISEKKSNERILENVIKNFVDELFKKEVNYYCLVSSKMEVTVIRSYNEVKSENKLRQIITDEISMIINSIKKFLDIDITVCISNIFNSFKSLNEKYEKTKDLLNYSFHLGNENIFYEKDLENKIELINADQLNSLFISFRNSLEKLDFSNAKIQLNMITAEFNGHYYNQNYRTLDFYCKLLTSIVDKSMELSLYSYIFTENINPYDFVLHSKTIYDVDNYLFGLLENFEKGSGIELKTQYGETIGKVMNYVLLNFYKDINLNRVAEELGFNPSYLSAKFKEITHNSFNEYLNTVRINTAKKLLIEGKYKINKVSNMVGYSDQRYFCKIFKKVVGMTPGEYISAISYL